MKNIVKCLFLLCFGLNSSNTMAQIKIPQLSPAAKAEQQIGLAKATITYNRPSSRVRKLLGQNDIPYGKVWRMAQMKSPHWN